MRDPQVRTYDPKKVVITWGTIIFTGYMSGTFITIARSGDIFEKDKGSDGTIDRINKNAVDFAVTVTLKQTSITNDLLSAAMKIDIESNTSIYPLTVADVGGTTLFFASQAWIGKDPDDEHSDSLVGREWRFDTGPAEKFTGGNIA
ncbi:MAG: hypothetical protein PVI88_00250 [Nitrosopumilaceae archaeon]|jgi:hypothetical protein